MIAQSGQSIFFKVFLSQTWCCCGVLWFQVDQMMENLNTNLSKINIKQNAEAKRAEDEMEGMRRKFQDLAMKIFVRHPPDHTQQAKGQCPHCQV